MSVLGLFCSSLRLKKTYLSFETSCVHNIETPLSLRYREIPADYSSFLTQCRNLFCRLKWLYTYSGLASLYLPAQLLPFSGPKSMCRKRVYKMDIFLLCLYSQLDNVWHNICVQVTQPQTLGRNQRKSQKTSYAEPEKKKWKSGSMWGRIQIEPECHRHAPNALFFSMSI